MADRDDGEEPPDRSRWDRLTRPPFRIVFNGWWILFLFLIVPFSYYAGLFVSWADIPSIMVDSVLFATWGLTLQVFSHTRDFREP
ncbi:MAG: hypothetical protein V5A84_03015 [Planctomycetota bacterium]